jgi:hypothetical protein
MKQYINEAKRMQKLAGLEVKADTTNDLNESQLRSLVREIVEEAVFSSGDVNAILKSAKAALEAGKKVTVDGKEIIKIVPAAGAFFPADGGPSLRIKNYIGNPEKIVIDGVPAELKPMEDKPHTPVVDKRTPEEKAKAKADYEDRYGPNGGVQTAFGKYTGD